jgi:acyl-coenzyme A thioesterase 9
MPMRVKTPWVDALAQSREQNAGDVAAGQAVSSASSLEPDLTPRKMSDSYFAVVSPFPHLSVGRIWVASGCDLFPFVYADFVDDEVLPLAQDKWLLDSYLNASGRIRYFTLPAHLL